MARTRVKVCGLTRAEDAALAVELGASLVGCVRSPRSPRHVSVEECERVFSTVPPRIRRVLVTRGISIEQTVRDSRALRPDLVQPHGVSAAHERALERAGLSLLRVVRIDRGATAIPELPGGLRPSRPAVLDVGAGGSGTRFDWGLLQWTEASLQGLFIAGGIGPENVSELLPYRPFGIDLSSGIESSPGVKDPGRLRSLFERLAEGAGA